MTDLSTHIRRQLAAKRERYPELGIPAFDATEDKIRAEHAAAVDKIRNDDKLTPAIRQRRLAALHVEARAKLDSLETKFKAERAATLDKARRAAFGVDDLVASASDATALHANHRAALDQVDKIDDLPTAIATMGRANDLGDEVLARSVAYRAFSKGWTPVVDTYMASRPKAGEAIQTLLTAPEPSFQDGLRFVVPTPSELGRANDYQLAQLAAGEVVPGISTR